MSKAPAVQFYTGDFLTGTALMSNAEVGLYMRLLCLQAENGSVPDDIERIVQTYGEPCRALWKAVRKKFHRGSAPEGEMVNAKMSEVLAARDAFRARQSEKGKASGKVRTNHGTTTVEPQPNRGSTPVQPIEDGDEEGDRVEGGEEVREKGSGKKPRTGPDPGVQAVIDHLTTRLIEEGVAKGLDGAATNNRWAARSLLLKVAKEYPDHDPVETVKALIEAALKDEFHRRNSTTVRYLLNNCGKIIAAHKATKNGKGTIDDYRQQVAASAARRFGKPTDPQPAT